jgi:hypothetical protein
MIPWFDVGPAVRFPDGGEWTWFQLLFLLGWVGGALLTIRQAIALGVDEIQIRLLTVAGALVGILVGHLIAVFAYNPHALWGTPCAAGEYCADGYLCATDGTCGDGRWGVIFEPFNGFMTAGAEAGVVLCFAIWWLCWGRRSPSGTTVEVAWSLTLLPLSAFWLSSIGCWMANDHLTRPLILWISTAYPDGVLAGVPAVAGYGPTGYTNRVNLGFAHFLVCSGFGLIPLARAFVARKWTLDFSLALLLTLYGSARMVSGHFYATDIATAEPRWFASETSQGWHLDSFTGLATLCLTLPLWWCVLRDRAIWLEPKADHGA